MLSTETGCGFSRTPRHRPLRISMIRSAMGAMAELCVITTTVMPFSRQVSCKSFRIALPVW